MARIGPFFYIDGQLIFRGCAPEYGEARGGKLDNPYSHARLYDRRFRTGDYIDFPRGRVVYDTERSRAIVYIDRCIRRPEVLEKIAAAFELTDFVVESDTHYRCRDCVGALWDD